MHNLNSNGAPPFPDLFCDDALRIETRRLWLRWPVYPDAARLHEIASMEAAARPTAIWPHPLPEGEALRRIVEARGANERGHSLVLALTEKAAPDALIGVIGVGAEEDMPGIATVAYMLGVKHQGYGLMTETLRAVLDFVFDYTPFRAIRGASGVDNAASRRVMEKAGFRLAGERSHSADGRAAGGRGGKAASGKLELTRVDWWSRRLVGGPVAHEALKEGCTSACAA